MDFLNITNHKLTIDQEAAAKSAWIGERGKVVNLPDELAELWRSISPEANTDEVGEQVQKISDWVAGNWPSTKNDGGHWPNAVALVAGEPMAVLYLVAALQSIPVPCVSATTRRESVENDGVKTSVFRHVRFRTFPQIKVGMVI